MEEAANNFAQNTLIPFDEYQEFISMKKFSEREIVAFASKVEIDYGIVVGRLQKEGYIPYTKYNNLKTKYSISY